MSKIIEIIDDEPDMLKMLKSLLSDHFKNIEIITGNTCNNLKKVPDILITDYLTPGLNGIDRIAHCICNGHTPPTIIYTAWESYIDKKEYEPSLKENPNIVVIQKTNLTMLIDTINKILYKKSLITICKECKNPIYWLDLIDPNVDICEGCFNKIK